MTYRTVRSLGLIVLLVATDNASAATLRDALRELSEARDFEIRNLDRVGDESAFPTSGALTDRLKALLAAYNHVLFHDRQGRVVQVIVSSRKGPPPERVREVTLSTRRKGSHHVVDAVLMGDNAAPQRVELMVDTGASAVVLPASMLGRLGLDPDSLQARTVRTANGEVNAKLGRLRSVEVGGVVVSDVEVVFVPDKKLGQQRLLGMSFLSRFRVTIDDAKGGVILGVE